jgi:hypothetical protein
VTQLEQKRLRTEHFCGSTRSKPQRKHECKVVYEESLPSYRTSSFDVKKFTRLRSQIYKTKPPT